MTVFFIAFGGTAVLLLWNWLVPDLFGLRQLTFWEALGLLALSRILFGGFGRGGHGHDDGRRRGKHRAWWKESRESKPAAPAPPEAAQHG
jgi:hypothetical protein